MNAEVAWRRWQLALRLAVIALVWSFGLLLAAVLVPAYNGNTNSAADGVTLTRVTLVQSHGAGWLALVVIPVLACAAVLTAMVARHRDDAWWSGRVAWTAIGLLTLESLLGILTIGGFILPAVVLLALAVRTAPPWADVRARPEPVDERSPAAA